jgi:predicted nucleic acid-binding Zn ribbon protein
MIGRPIDTAGSFCPKCGSPVPTGAQFCSKCGGSLGLQHPLPRKSRKGLWVGLAVLIVVIIAVVAVALWYYSTTTGVNVTGINWTGSNSCGGLSGKTTSGFTGGSGITYQLTESDLYNADPLFSCTINAVTSGTSGFTVTAGNFPLTIPASGHADLSVTISGPSSYNGVLTLVVS